MICTKKEFIRTGADGTKWWQVVLTSDTDPDTLNLTGADVENLNDALGLAAGSILITPTANYIAFEDGVFTAKGEGGGGGGGAPSVEANNLTANDLDILFFDSPAGEQLSGTVRVPAGGIRTFTCEAGVYMSPDVDPNIVNIETSGDCEKYVGEDNYYYYLVSGNCRITVSGGIS